MHLDELAFSENRTEHVGLLKNPPSRNIPKSLHFCGCFCVPDQDI